jgi:hypothetical protein
MAHARFPAAHHSEGLTFAGVGTFVIVADALRNRWAWADTTADYAAKGFRLTRNMALLVTDRRLVVCRWPGIFRRRPVVLRVVPRRAITSATLPFIGGAWRSVLLVVHGVRLHLLVKASDPEDFVRELSS